MFAYLLRRLLIMIPTFVGILVINFGVLRLQGNSLVELAQTAGSGKGGEGVAGERKAGGASSKYENYIDRFRRIGNDLPPLINLRGFLVKDEVVVRLRHTEPASGLKDSKRNREEKDLWIAGHFAVQPLYEVLQDDSLKGLHGPASQAYALCAHITLDQHDLDTMPPELLSSVQERNQTLRQNVIAYRLGDDGHFAIDDADYGRKRAALIAAFESDPAPWEHSPARAWQALALETGFCDFIRRLATGDLWSESKKAYVFTVIAQRWKTTFWLNMLAVAIAWLGSIPLGIRSARRLGTIEDSVTTNLLFLLWSLPSFFVGTLLLHYLCSSDGVKCFPLAGLSSDGSLWYSIWRYLADLAWHAFLPLVVLSYGSFTVLSRYMRGNLLEQIDADYVRTARAKGVSEDAVVYRHALPNSLITMVTMGSGLLAELFGGVLVVELIFSIPGLGWLLLDAARQQDAPLIMGATVIQVGLLLVSILVADVLYGVIDPRIRNRYA